MAVASAGAALRRFPLVRAINITAAITPALRTDGDGLTSKRNKIKKMAVADICIANLFEKYRMTQSTNALTIAKFAPLTAVR
jgi:hypothetical protein